MLWLYNKEAEYLVFDPIQDSTESWESPMITQVLSGNGENAIYRIEWKFSLIACYTFDIGSCLCDWNTVADSKIIYGMMLHGS